MFLSRENHLNRSVLFIMTLVTALAMAGLTGCAGTSGGDPSSYTVQFDAAGGSPTPAQQTVANNGKVATPSPVPSRDGYTLEGWYADVATQLWDFNADTVMGNITLHAKWREVSGEAEYNKEALQAAGEITLTAKDRDGNDVALAVEVKDDTIVVSVIGVGSFEYPSAITDSTIILEGAGEGGGNATLGYVINDDGTLTITSGLNQIAGANLASGPVTSDENENLTQPEITFTVRFDAQGGTPAPEQQTVAKNGKAAGPSPAPTRAGYILDGWYTEATYTNRWNFDVNTVTAAVTLYAKWTAVAANSFVVSFDSRGGGEVANQSVTSGGKAVRPANPARPEFTFDNWYTEAAYTTVYDFDAPVTGNITLYAKWAAIVRYTVTFDAQGGSPTPGVQNVVSGEKAAGPSPAPAKGGYTLDGWYREAAYTNRWDFAVNTVTAAVTLYAKWTAVAPDEFVVSFDSAGGDEVADQTVTSGGKAARPDDPTQENYTFDNWYTEAAYTTVYDFNTPVTGNITLYAKWTAIVRYAVAFDAQGGIPEPATQNVVSGEKATGPTPAPTKGGYTLAGWYTEAEGTNRWDFDTTVTAAMVLYAKWTAVAPDSFVVSFDSTGGSEVADQSVTSGGKATRPANPTREDYTFDDWYTQAAYTTVYDFNTPVTGNITLYAKWTAVAPDEFVVSFDSTGGDEVADQTVTSGGKAARPANPIREDYTFDNWYKEAAYTTVYNFDTPVTGNITLYAKWTAVAPDSFVVSFDSADGSEVADQTVTSGGKAVRPANPTRQDYTFDNWYTEAAYTTVYNFDTPVTAAITLYAKWTAVVANSFVVSFDSRNGSAVADQTVTRDGKAVRPDDPTRQNFTFYDWYTEAAYTTVYNFDTPVTANFTLYARWIGIFVPVTEIVSTIPGSAITDVAINLNTMATVSPGDATDKTIVWTVKGTTATGVTNADLADRIFTPLNGGTLVLTATIINGTAMGTPFVMDDITIVIVKPVTSISGAPSSSPKGSTINLDGATALPENATNRTIVWSVTASTAAGVAVGDSAPFTPTGPGLITLTATIVDGAAVGTPFTDSFDITISEVGQFPGEVGFGEETSLRVRDSGDNTINSGDPVKEVTASSYSISLVNASQYTGFAWHINGTKSPVTDSRLVLDMTKKGLVRVTVEAYRNGVLDTGSFTFDIK